MRSDLDPRTRRTLERSWGSSMSPTTSSCGIGRFSRRLNRMVTFMLHAWRHTRWIAPRDIRCFKSCKGDNNSLETTHQTRLFTRNALPLRFAYPYLRTERRRNRRGQLLCRRQRLR